MIALAAGLFFVAPWNFGMSSSHDFSNLLDGVPLILGMILAFVSNVPMKRIEQVLEKINPPRVLRRSRNPWALLWFFLFHYFVVDWLLRRWLLKPCQLGDSVNHLPSLLILYNIQKLMQSSMSQITDSLSQKQYRIVCSLHSLADFTPNILGSSRVLCNCGDFLHDWPSVRKYRTFNAAFFNVAPALSKIKSSNITYVGEVIADTCMTVSWWASKHEAGIAGVMIFAGYCGVKLCAGLC